MLLQDHLLSEKNLKEYLKDTNLTKLTDNESKLLEGDITMSELTKALKNMKNNKVQEQMAFRANFLRFSGKKIGIFVMRSVNHSYNIGELALIQRQGIITLIPKENKSRQKITNYGPICLLNTVYKIASASIANHIKQSLTNLSVETRQALYQVGTLEITHG